MKKNLLLLLAVGAFILPATAQTSLKYQTPPKSIVDLADASFPRVQFSKDGKYMLTLESPGFESIERVSQPILGLAGLRVNPATNALEPESGGSYTTITIKELATGKVNQLAGLPDGALLSRISWSPDNSYIAFVNRKLDGGELWVADTKSFTARKLTEQILNLTFGSAIQWHPSGEYLLVQSINEKRGVAPQAPIAPDGPIVQENLGTRTPARTYQNLLGNPHDEKLMDYYLTSQLIKVDLQGNISPIYKPAIFRSTSFSPDGNYILAQTIERPYSYLVPIYSFPHNTSILDAAGKLVKEVSKAPLADKVPIAFDAVAPGPRAFQWRKDALATLVWAEALDEGNPNNDVAFHDAVYYLEAPFTGEKTKLYSTRLRYNGIEWINNNYAIVRESWRKTRESVMTLINPQDGKVVKEIMSRISESAYTDPGRFIRNNEGDNEGVLLTDKGKGLSVFTTSTGASPEGDRPFIMKWNLLTDKKDTLFKSKAPYFEQPVFFNNTGVIFFSRESIDQAPNYYSMQLRNKKVNALTQFADPYPGLQGVSKTMLSYQRGDGITLTGTLYLPKGYKKEDGPLPVLVWAYPREYKTVAAAAEVKGSPYRFPRISWGSPVYWVTRGYAVVDNADMPIVGTGKEEPNNTFVAQITDNANSLINHLESLGVGDRNRIGVGGHSYGAFMTANLLAHTNLFAAGIARSGAYNRTLTPFGFQNETRTFWQAPDVYGNMSPFYHADKIKTPILLIHGMDDENSGTFPIQSERLYSAVKGHGGIIRLAMLPKEFHGYRSRESILHTLWEQDQWLEKYVKNRKKGDSK